MNKHMAEAILQAKEAINADEVPIGAVIVHNGQIIAAAHNKDIANSDPTAHAEMLVIRQACERLGSERIPECDLYVTLEPCTMCATAISYARIRRLYFGAYDPKRGGTFWFEHNTCHHKPEVYGGISESECGDLLRDFFNKKR